MKEAVPRSQRMEADCAHPKGLMAMHQPVALQLVDRLGDVFIGQFDGRADRISAYHRVVLAAIRRGFREQPGYGDRVRRVPRQQQFSFYHGDCLGGFCRV
jgi:hypothetical protein